MESEENTLRRILEEIRDDQRKLLRQSERMVELGEEKFEIVKRQQERTDRIQDRAEALQTRSERLVGGARKAFIAILPILIALVIYISWLLFRLIF